MRITAELYYALIGGQRRGPIASLARLSLGMASWPYGIGVRTRNLLFDRGWKSVYRPGIPVVSVGNLTLGGTGKTPCVERVARFYRDMGVGVAIVSRGYGVGVDGGRNDEALVLEDNLPDVPHLQGRNRSALAGTAERELKSEVLVLDDGFQHRRLHRDLDMILIDATRPPNRDHLFPRGTLREPASGLRRAGLILLTRCDQVRPTVLAEIRGWLTRSFPGLPVAATEHRSIELLGGARPEPVSALRGRQVAGFCGIGNPEAFRRTLQDLGAKVLAFRAFPDHHRYSDDDRDDLVRWSETLPTDALIATTQKDWVKLRMATLSDRPLRAVRIGLVFRDGENRFEEALRRLAVAQASRLCS